MAVRKAGNSWSFRIDVGRDPQTGKRRQKYQSGFRTKKEAEQAQADFMIRINTEGYFQLKKETMEIFLKKWLETVYKHEVKSTTFEKAECVVRVHIMPVFGQREVNSIKPYDIQKFFSDKAKSGLSPATIRKIKNVLSKAFQTAIDWELINKNPIEKVKLPSIVKSEKEIWSAEEAKRFLESCDELRWKVAFSLALHTGMRRGEILGLKWENVDFENAVIKIKESLAYTKSEGLFFSTPKTPNSVREVLLPSSLIRLMRELNIEQKKMKLRMGVAYHSYDLVVSTVDGKPLHPRNLARTFDNLIKKAGVKRISLHGMRHTNATMLMKEGVNPKIVSKRLGHANVGFTLDIYSHTDLQMQREPVLKLEEAFLN